MAAKSIWCAAMEITTHKNISTAEALHLLLKDMEEHYHDDLLFKDTANSRRDELKSLNNKIGHYRFTLQISPLVEPALRNLFQNSVSEHDIIEINQLVQDYKNTLIVPLDDYSEGKDTKHDKDNKPDFNWFCRSLTDELKRYGGVNLAIRKQSEKQERIRQEINDLNKQKQDVLAYCHLAIALAAFINSKISFLRA